MVRRNNHLLIVGCLFLILWSCGIDSVSESISQKQKLEIEKQVRYWSVDTLFLELTTAQVEGNDLKILLIGETLGNRLRSSSKFQEAIDAHRLGLSAAYRIKDTIEIAQALNNLGTDYRRLGGLDEASKFHYEALSISELYNHGDSLANASNVMTALNGIGNICLSLNDLSRAELYFKRAIDLEEKFGRPLGLAINYANLGTFFEQRMVYDSAFFYYEKSLEQNKIAKSKLGIALCHIHFGELYEKQGDYVNAKKEYEDAYQEMQNLDDRWHWLDACIAVGRIYLLEDNFVESDKYFNQALIVAREINSLEHMSSVHENLYMYYEKLGNATKALEEYKIHQELKDKILSERHLSQFTNVQVNYEVSKSTKKIDELVQENDQLSIRFQRWLFVFVALIMSLVISLYIYQSIVLRRTRKLKNVLQIETEKAKESEKMKNTFINSMCHEIRTPLNAISGFAQLLFDEDISVDIKKDFQGEIEKNTDLLTSLLTDLLEVANLDSIQTELEKKQVDVLTICRNEIDNLSHLHDTKKNIKCAIDFDDEQCMLYTNPHYFELIVHCLLSNAVKFTDDGIIVLSCHHDKPEEVTFSITDTGCGIPPDKKDVIFERFVKLNTFKSGTGLGLYICKLAVNKLGGNIYLDTKYINGARFVVTLTQ